MPELPEVETIRRDLAPLVLGRRIAGAAIFWPRTVRQPSPRQFLRRIGRKEIYSLSRRGKFLIFHLSGGASLVFHLKMTGSLLVLPPGTPPDRYTRLSFSLVGQEGPSSLHFRDQRKFGGAWLVKDIGRLTARLGPEPLSREFTAGELARIIEGRPQPIKVLLLDQSRIAGLGNMYADEALFEAGVHPLRPAGQLSAAETARLHRAIRRVLRRGIRGCGASIANYCRPDGSSGWAHESFRVAHRRDQPCPRCGKPIERISLRGRGSYFCPHCQRLTTR